MLALPARTQTPNLFFLAGSFAYWTWTGTNFYWVLIRADDRRIALTSCFSREICRTYHFHSNGSVAVSGYDGRSELISGLSRQSEDGTERAGPELEKNCTAARPADSLGRLLPKPGLGCAAERTPVIRARPQPAVDSRCAG